MWNPIRVASPQEGEEGNFTLRLEGQFKKFWKGFRPGF